MVENRFFIVGGAGFIGSHFVDRFLADPATEQVTVYDNFSSGQLWHLEHHEGDRRLRIVRGEVADLDNLTAAMEGHELVVHLASNPDIARAMTDPAVDFHQGTVLTHSVVEAMRLSETPRILYASGSGIYGDQGETNLAEDFGPPVPISTYGASKLAGEGLICSYCHMFGMTGRAFRFGNVVGPRQTHGVGFDFMRRLRDDPTELRILGDGLQSKSYIHVHDVIRGVLLAHERTKAPYEVYNLATGDYINVREIAELAVEVSGLEPGSVRFRYTGGAGGWKGDVPVVRLNTDKIRALGWDCPRGAREALRDSLMAIREQIAEPAAVAG
ncbi:MAG: NAD-dependent epimerase/dehydratase family protein [Bryobacterales bacterium]